MQRIHDANNKFEKTESSRRKSVRVCICSTIISVFYIIRRRSYAVEVFFFLSFFSLPRFRRRAIVREPLAFCLPSTFSLLVLFICAFVVRPRAIHPSELSFLRRTWSSTTEWLVVIRDLASKLPSHFSFRCVTIFAANWAMPFFKPDLLHDDFFSQYVDKSLICFFRLSVVEVDPLLSIFTLKHFLLSSSRSIDEWGWTGR